MATAVTAEGNFASATAGERLDIIGIEADYDGPSYVADNTSLLLSARQFDFSSLFDMIEEEDIGTPRLLLSWQTDAVTRVRTGDGVYHQAPRYLDIASDPSNLDLKSERSTQLVLGYSRYLREDLRFSAEGYYQKLDDLIVFDDRTTNAATNIGEGSATGRGSDACQAHEPRLERFGDLLILACPPR